MKNLTIIFILMFIFTAYSQEYKSLIKEVKLGDSKEKIFQLVKKKKGRILKPEVVGDTIVAYVPNFLFSKYDQLFMIFKDNKLNAFMATYEFDEDYKYNEMRIKVKKRINKWMDLYNYKGAFIEKNDTTRLIFRNPQQDNNKIIVHLILTFYEYKEIINYSE